MGESITGGVLSAWRVKDGDWVERDQVIYELETDKITQEGAAETAGRISIKVEEGDEVTIGQVVAEIEESAAQGEEAAAPATAEPAPPTAQASPAATHGAGTISPAVRRLATETGIDPSQVEGSGKAGRVTKGDMLAAAEQPPVAPPVAAAAPEKTAAKVAPPASSGERQSRKKLSPLRQRIGQRLVASQKDAAILSTFNEVDLSAVRDLRARYQDTFVKKHGVKLGFMSFFIKATVDALKEIPQLNSQLEGDTLVQNHFYDIGVAVSSEKGLLVPVIRNCDQLSMPELEKELIAYAKKARDGKIKIEDLEGGVFTISNGGIFGSLLSTPIINPPQSGILGMHTIQDRPVAVNGQVVIRPMMYLALSYDHRIVDGREAVTFLVRIKQALEDPARLLLNV
jgi:2-oxoglutarate dehydrogenase E2 component (dihydrolipoamide succinyltransferase)